MSPTLRSLLFLFFLSLCSSSFAQSGEERYISTSGTDAEGCGSKESPCKTFGHIFKLSKANDEIVVSPGTYRDTNNANITVDVNITIRAQNPAKEVVIDLSTSLYYGWQFSQYAAVQGITFTNAVSTILIFEKSGAVLGCKFSNNSGVSSLVLYYEMSILNLVKGCVFFNNNLKEGSLIETTAPLKIDTVTFTQNNASLIDIDISNWLVVDPVYRIMSSIFSRNTFSPMIKIYSSETTKIPVTIEHSQFMHNSGNLRFQKVGVIIFGSTFFENTDGVLVCSRVSSLHVIDSNFFRNTKSGEGTIFLAESEGSFLGGATFEGCTFRGNIVSPPSETTATGGILTSVHSLNLTGCTVDINHSKGDGGFILARSVVTSNMTIIIDSCVMTGNTAVKNGGVVMIDERSDNVSIIVRKSKLSDNGAWQGGAIYLGGIPRTNNLTIIESQIQNNDALEEGGGIYCSEQNIIVDDKSIIKGNKLEKTKVNEVYCNNCDLKGPMDWEDLCVSDLSKDKKTALVIIAVAASLVGVAVIGLSAFFLIRERKRRRGTGYNVIPFE